MTTTFTAPGPAAATGTAVPQRRDRHGRPASGARAARPTCAAPVRRRPAELVAAPVSPAPARRARLTRRGRLTVLVVLAALLFGAFSLGRSASEAASQPAPAAQLEQTTVQPGDTLWAVARRIAPQHDPREVIDQLRKVNGLTSSELQAGQQLLVPATR